MHARARLFAPGDERAIVELSNRALSRYAGWVPRTVEYWRWAILARPGVDAADIVVLESEGTILAYGALHKSGEVLDFVVDASQPHASRGQLATRLVSVLEESARAHKLDMLSFSLPVSDRA